MCGIAGITGKQSERCDSRAAVERMASLISHRGPDESSIYEDEDVILGHARLSIIDLVGGAQPIHNKDRSVWVVFNGEIFNYSIFLPF